MAGTQRDTYIFQIACWSKVQPSVNNNSMGVSQEEECPASVGFTGLVFYWISSGGGASLLPLENPVEYNSISIQILKRQFASRTPRPPANKGMFCFVVNPAAIFGAISGGVSSCCCCRLLQAPVPRLPLTLTAWSKWGKADQPG